MNDSKEEQAKHNRRIKKTLRVIGFIAAPLGAILVITAFIDFFVSMNNESGGPRFFWMFFLGFPLIFVGIVCLVNGHMKEISRYVASEQVPVATDVTNAMLSGTREETAKTAGALANAVKTTVTNGTVCPKCGTVNESGAVFCDHCGAALKKTCSCGEVNDADAEFCRKCGKRLS